MIFDYDGSFPCAPTSIGRDLVAQSYTYQEFPLREFAEGHLEHHPPTTNILVQSPGMHTLIASPVISDDYDLAINIHREGGRRVSPAGMSRVGFSGNFLKISAGISAVRWLVWRISTRLSAQSP